MGNEQSSMPLTDEEREFYRRKGYNDFAEKCKPIDAANAAKRERWQREQEAQAGQRQAEQDALRKSAIDEAEVKKAIERAAAEKAKADRIAAELKVSEERKEEQARQEVATRKASEKEALEKRLAAAQESLAQSKEARKEAEQAGLRDKFRHTSLPTRPPQGPRTQLPPTQQKEVDRPTSSSSDGYLTQWGLRKERRRVDFPLDQPTNRFKSADEDALSVADRPYPSRQTSTNKPKQSSSADTSPTSSNSRASIAHEKRPESSSGVAATPASASTVLLKSAEPSLANIRNPSHSNGAVQAPGGTVGIKRPIPLTGLASLGRIPKKSRTSMSTSTSPQSPPSGTANDERGQPQWYSNMVPSGRRDRHSSTADTLLAKLRQEITNAKKCYNTDDYPGRRTAFANIRALLHDLSFSQVNERLLRDNAMFHNDRGLPQLFDTRYDGGVNWPEDVRADAEELYQKWYMREFDTDIMRGINFTMSGEQGGDCIDPKAKNSSKYVGNGSLVNGQWWPLLLCAVRDGAHGETIKGIAGERGRGAYSCLLSGGTDPKYPDEDEGDIVRYCGTDSKNGEITVGTQQLLDSMANGIPVRFIRSHKAKDKSKFAPVRGFRYDGLYDVKEYEILDQTLQRHRFLLERRPGQGPIRGGDVEGARPTAREVAEYDTHKRLAGGKAAAYY